jgi:prevent-host-death family protein
MTITTISSRQFNQDASKAKRAAAEGPVFITDRGKPAHVLLTFEDYQRLSRSSMSLLEALAADDDIDFDPPRLRDDLATPAEFD